MAPDIVPEENGRTRGPYRNRQRFQHCALAGNMKKESERLKTFSNWNVSFMDSNKLAKSGFYYTNISDMVMCAFCKAVIGCWNEGDDPEEHHKRLSSNCPRYTGQACEEEDDDDEDVTSQDVCGFYGLEIRPFSAPERCGNTVCSPKCKSGHGKAILAFPPTSHCTQRHSQAGKIPFSIESSDLCRNFEELGVSKISGPVSPCHATYNSRLKTYRNWPIPEIQSPENLAEAGFYYTGANDNVLCFHCGGGLKNWEVEDDPWMEHAHWFSKCGFVILRKGRQFVVEVLEKGRSEVGKQVRRRKRRRRREGRIVGRMEREKEEEGEDDRRDVFQSGKKEKEKEKEEGRGKEERKEEEEKVVEMGSEERREESVSRRSSVEASVSSSSGWEKVSERSESPDPDKKEIELCRICYVRERGIVFLPCGHFVSCTECAPSLSTCAVCRKPFEATVRAYLS